MSYKYAIKSKSPNGYITYVPIIDSKITSLIRTREALIKIGYEILSVDNITNDTPKSLYIRNA